MSSRDDILKAIRQNKPDPVALPDLPTPSPPPANLVPPFKTMVEAIGGQVIETSSSDDIAAILAERYPDQTTIGSAVPGLVAGTLDLENIDDPHALAPLDLFVCRGDFGVAENGAVWVRDSRMIHRAAPFLTQHLALVLERTALVATMHDAYARLRIDAEGFGLFIAGPSKTADIEQALVIGAHGPRSLTVLLT